MQRERRQVSVDELIHTALQFVRPIFDTSQALVPNQQDPIIHKKMLAEAQGLRESAILGTSPYSSLREVPICRGNSQICKFISCTAHNFKYDQSMANLNLAAQLISDRKFRESISRLHCSLLLRNPEAISTVCHEQGLSTDQCRLFSRAFQLVDKFISTLEKAQDGPQTNGVVHDTHATMDHDDDDLEEEEDDLEQGFSNPERQILRDAEVNTTTNPPTVLLTTHPHSLHPRQMTPIRPINQHLPTPKNLSSPTEETGPYMGSRTWSTHSRGFIDTKQHYGVVQPPATSIDSVRNVLNYGDSAALSTPASQSMLLARPMGISPPTTARLVPASSWNLLVRPTPPPFPPRASMPLASLSASPAHHYLTTVEEQAKLSNSSSRGPLLESSSFQKRPILASTIPEAEEDEETEDTADGNGLSDGLRDVIPTKKSAHELFKPIRRKRRASTTDTDYYDEVHNKENSVEDGEDERAANKSESKGGRETGKKQAHSKGLKLNCLQYIG